MTRDLEEGREVARLTGISTYGVLSAKVSFVSLEKGISFSGREGRSGLLHHEDDGNVLSVNFGGEASGRVVVLVELGYNVSNRDNDTVTR